MSYEDELAKLRVMRQAASDAGLAGFGAPTVLAEQRAERDAVLATFELTRPQVLARLRQAAWARWRLTAAPVSTNDVLEALAALGYEGNRSILGAVFRGKEWEPAGETQTVSSEGHARRIRLWRPRKAAG